MAATEVGMKRFAAIFAGLALAGAAGAAGVPFEKAELGSSEVTLYLHDFLTEEEVTTLRLVLTNTEALAIFVPAGKDGFAALAVSPEDGLIRDGKPVPSATALAGFDHPDTAETEAKKACDAARKGSAPCVLVLAVGPKP